MPVKVSPPAGAKLPEFLPVIFADGQTDDAPGLQAAFDNRAVILDDQVVNPDEDVILMDRQLALWSIVDIGNIAEPKSDDRRTVHFENCTFACWGSANRVAPFLLDGQPYWLGRLP